MIVDCHVNVYEDLQLLQLQKAVSVNARPGSFQLLANPEKIHAAMAAVDKAIIFSLRYANSAGIDGDDEVTAARCREISGQIRRLRRRWTRAAPMPWSCCGMPSRTSISRASSPGRSTAASRCSIRGWSRSTPTACRHNLPLTLHMGTTYARNAPAELGRPIYVDEIALRHPGAQDRHGAHGAPLVRRMHYRRPQAAQRVLRSIGAVSTGHGSSTTSSSRRRNTRSTTAARSLGHRLSLHRRGGIAAGPARRQSSRGGHGPAAREPGNDRRHHVFEPVRALVARRLAALGNAA